jgi:hypothetical protein
MTTNKLHGNERIESDRSRVPVSGGVLVLDDDGSDDDRRDDATRSEPVDFDHGESTGVQEL